MPAQGRLSTYMGIIKGVAAYARAKQSDRRCDGAGEHSPRRRAARHMGSWAGKKRSGRTGR